MVYGEPTVYQKRNVHNYLTDFKNETVGYNNNLKLIEDLYKKPEKILISRSLSLCIKKLTFHRIKHLSLAG